MLCVVPIVGRFTTPCTGCRDLRRSYHPFPLAFGMGRHASSHLWASATSLDAPEWFQSPRHARPDMLGRPLAEQLVATRHNLSPEESYRSVSSKPLGGRTLVSPHRLVSPDTPKEWRADERRFYGQGDYANISASLPKLSVRAFADRPTAAQSPANSPLPRIQQWYETHSRDKFANTPPTTVKSLLDTNASLWSIHCNELPSTPVAVSLLHTPMSDTQVYACRHVLHTPVSPVSSSTRGSVRVWPNKRVPNRESVIRCVVFF